MAAFVAVEGKVESPSRVPASESIGEEEEVFLGGGGPIAVVISSVQIVKAEERLWKSGSKIYKFSLTAASRSFTHHSPVPEGAMSVPCG